MKRIAFLSILLVTGLYFQALSQVVYVNQNASGTNDGSSWVNAFTDLQLGLSAATAGDQIWVAKGTYKPSVPSGRSVTFQLVADVAVYGGFEGSETLLSQRDYTLNETILSGDIGAQGTSTDNAYHVVTGIDNAILDGFTIRDGFADVTITNGSGGGMYNANGSNINNLTIKNCTFKNNYAIDKGMAIYNFMATNLLIDNCTFTYNDFAVSSNTTVKGGAIYSAQGSSTISNSYFDHNNSGSDGGAIYNDNNSPTVIQNTDFIANQSTNGNGGAIYSYLTTDIKNCVFSFNSAHLNGGGIYAETPITVMNSTFYNNLAAQKGGNFVDNSATASAITNTILWDGNAGTGDGADYRNLAGLFSNITYSCLSHDYTEVGNITGIGNIYYPADPKFVDNNSDWHIQPGSSCIDAGNGDVAPTLDKDGNIRFDDSSKTNSGVGTPAYVDMGAYENQHNSPLHGTYTIGSTGDFQNFSEATDSLISLGIDGAVIFNVQSGTYNEQVTLPGIVGESSINTITFQSQSGDSTDVILTYASTVENNNYTLKLDSADYVTFKGITLQATGTTYARVVELDRGACNNLFTNNQFIGVPGVSELVYSYFELNDIPDTTNTFTNNLFHNGKNGIKITKLGSMGTSTPFSKKTTIRYNQFLDQSEKSISLGNSMNSHILNNYISSDSSCTGIYLTELSDGDTISNNIIQLPVGGTGINLYNCYQAATDTSLISNNFIYLNTTNPDHAINIFNTSTAIKCLYNTVHITGDNTGSYCIYTNGAGTNNYKLINNNIFANEAKGQAAYFYYTPTSDYNNLYSNGQYLIKDNDLAWWQDHFNQDLHSLTVNPYFTGDTSWHVQNPALNGVGTPLATVTTDLDGELRDATNPDIGADEFTPNSTPLSGTYTIGGGSPDYTTINKAVEDVVINGVSGPVVFNIASGTYNEQITIQEIAGTSATNTVTFQSVSGDSTDVIINYTPLNTTHKHTIQLNGADYIILKNLSITTGELWGIPIQLKSEATHNQLQGNYIYKATQAPFSWDYALVYSKGSADSTNVFTGNYFENGNIGIYLDGSGSGTEITNNRFANIFFQGIYLKNNLSPIITGNTIEVTTSSSFSYGIYLQGSTYDGTQKGIVANNMILMNTSAGGAIGISTPSASYLSVIYNTVKINSGKAFTGSSNTDIINNIFTLGAGSYVAEISDTTGCEIDYNLYYQPNSSYAVMYYSTHSISNLEQYGFDLHSFAREPKFVSDTDLHTTDPWISNLGTPLTEITTDIDGEIRDSSHPDVGADEYIAATLFAGEYIIGPSGDFATFTEAADSIVKTGAIGPVIFKVQSGTYDEQFVLKEIPYAGVGDSITVTFTPEVAGDSTVIIQHANAAGQNYMVLLDSADYIRFEGLTFKALDATNGNIIYLAHGATHNIFSDNIFIGSTASGPIIYAKSDAVNDNDNHFTSNRFYNSDIAISLEGVADTNKATGLMVTSNRFEDQQTGAIIIHNQLSPQIVGNTILHINLITEKWAGIFLGACSSALIVNNEVSFQSDQLSAGIGLDSADHCGVYYNSIHITGMSTDTRCYNEENNGSSNVLKNNILSNEAGGIVMYNTDISSFTSDFNGFYVTGEHLIYTDAFIDDLTDWRATSGMDQHSVFSNPRFLSLEELKTTNPLFNNSATAIGTTTDIEGNIRDTTSPDMGAYEFNDAYYILGADSTICKNTSITLDAGTGYDTYLWNTGEETQSIITSASDTSATWYGVTVTYNGIDYTDSVKISFTGPVVDLPDTTGFCQGESVLLIAGDGNDVYDWSTGSTDPSISVNTVGNYFVKVTDTQGCFASDTVEVIESTGPAVDLGADASFCMGDTLTLDAGAGDQYTYLWNDQSIDRTMKAFESGQYSVTVTDQYGCNNSDDITLTENPLPTVDLGDDQTVCDGFSATLDAGSGFANYQWSDGTTFQTTSALVSGIYSVTVWDGNGCANTDSVAVTVNPPFTPALSSSGDELQVDYQTAMEYEWYVNQGYISSANSYTLIPSETGDYYVIVTDEYGCRGTTNTVSFTVTGIEEAARGVYQIYPNPSNGHLTIRYPATVKATQVTIFNSRGKIVYQESGRVKVGGYEQSIDLSGISKGAYVFRIEVNGRVYNQKLLIE